MEKRRETIGILMIFLILTAVGHNAWGAQSPEEYYRGKTIVWIFSGDAGSGGELITRTIAPFLEKETGAKVRIENKQTDEGVNFIYNRGSRDGLNLCTKSVDAIIGNEILKAPGVHYESEKFNYISDVYPSIKIFQASPKLPYKTLDALRKAKELKAGATSAKGSIAITSAVTFAILGLDGKVITGFKGKKELTLAVARGEVDFMITSDNAAKRDEKDGYTINMFTIGTKRSAAVPHVPSIAEVGVTIPKELESAHQFVNSAGTAVFFPPGVLVERVDFLRKAFIKLSENKELQNALGKLTGVIQTFGSGYELQKYMIEMKSDKGLAAQLDSIFKKYTAVR